MAAPIPTRSQFVEQMKVKSYRQMPGISAQTAAIFKEHGYVKLANETNGAKYKACRLENISDYVHKGMDLVSLLNTLAWLESCAAVAMIAFGVLVAPFSIIALVPLYLLSCCALAMINRLELKTPADVFTFVSGPLMSLIQTIRLSNKQHYAVQKKDLMEQATKLGKSYEWASSDLGKMIKEELARIKKMDTDSKSLDMLNKEHRYDHALFEFNQAKKYYAQFKSA